MMHVLRGDHLGSLGKRGHSEPRLIKLHSPLAVVLPHALHCGLVKLQANTCADFL